MRKEHESAPAGWLFVCIFNLTFRIRFLLYLFYYYLFMLSMTSFCKFVRVKYVIREIRLLEKKFSGCFRIVAAHEEAYLDICSRLWICKTTIPCNTCAPSTWNSYWIIILLDFLLKKFWVFMLWKDFHLHSSHGVSIQQTV